MGAISFSLDHQLVRTLKDVLPLTTLVETGTFQGETIAKCLQDFDEIISIEYSKQLYDEARQRFAEAANVRLLLGHSPDRLRELRANLREKAVLFWLDSHWCVGPGSSAMVSQCPLLEELDAIGEVHRSSVIAIDDARYFLAPPPAPHKVEEWPSFQSILERLREIAPHHKVSVVNDVILALPIQGERALFDYGRRHGADWLTIANKSRDYSEKEAVIQGLLAERAKLLAAVHRPVRLIAEAYWTKLRDSVPSLVRREYALRDKEMMLERMMNLQSSLRSANGVDQELRRLRQKIDRLEEGGVSDIAKGDKKLANRIRRFIGPRLGRLHQYTPRPLRVPNRYYVEQPPTRLAKISIVVPSFNQAGFLERTLESLFQQNYPDLEIVVSDGGSTDGSTDILKKYSSRLASWRSQPDEGQGAAINEGMSRATGEILAYLNSDDLLLPGAVSYVARYFEQNPDVDVVYGHRVLIDEDGFEIGRWVLPPHDSEVLRWADYVPQETLFWRRSIWEKCGARVDQSFRFALDWELLLRFEKTGARFARLPRFLGCFRVHEAQKTSSQIGGIGALEMARCREFAHGRAVGKTEVRRAVRPYLLRSMAYHFLYRWGALAY